MGRVWWDFPWQGAADQERDGAVIRDILRWSSQRNISSQSTSFAYVTERVKEEQRVMNGGNSCVEVFPRKAMGIDPDLDDPYICLMGCVLLRIHLCRGITRT
jgi:hypothetical protein